MFETHKNENFINYQKHHLFKQLSQMAAMDNVESDSFAFSCEFKRACERLAGTWRVSRVTVVGGHVNRWSRDESIQGGSLDKS